MQNPFPAPIHIENTPQFHFSTHDSKTVNFKTCFRETYNGMYSRPQTPTSGNWSFISTVIFIQQIFEGKCT